MKDDVAEELLGRIMGWDEPEMASFGPTLQALAAYKYDEYGTFRPGERFLESLARWLSQFASQDERRLAIGFVLNRLIFVSDSELEHAIELVYRDVVRPLVRDQVSKALGISRYRLAELVAAREFRRVSTAALGHGPL